MSTCVQTPIPATMPIDRQEFHLEPFVRENLEELAKQYWQNKNRVVMPLAALIVEIESSESVLSQPEKFTVEFETAVEDSIDREENILVLFQSVSGTGTQYVNLHKYLRNMCMDWLKADEVLLIAIKHNQVRLIKYHIPSYPLCSVFPLRTRVAIAENKNVFLGSLFQKFSAGFRNFVAPKPAKWTEKITRTTLIAFVIVLGAISVFIAKFNWSEVHFDGF